MAQYGDLSSTDFCRGILLGLTSDRITTVRLLSLEGHFAASWTFNFLATRSPIFDLSFRINLDPVHGESYDWERAVAYMKERGIITDEGGDRDFLIQPREEDLDRLWFPSQPGPRTLWVQCSRMYRHTFDWFLRTHPDPRSA